MNYRARAILALSLLAFGCGGAMAESFFLRRQSPGTKAPAGNEVVEDPVTLITDDGARRWSNSDDPTGCLGYITHESYETVDGDDAGDNGLYWINPGSGAVKAFCEMSLDGGGWTMVWRAAQDNYTSAPSGYDLDIALVAGSAETMIAFSNPATGALTSPWSFATPAEARSAIFFAANHVRKSVNARNLTSLTTTPNATLVFGGGNYSSNPGDTSDCDGYHNATASWGRFCIDNTSAPYFNGWTTGNLSADGCTTSTQGYNAGPSCSATRRFAIFVRAGAAPADADIVLASSNGARRWNDYSVGASCDAYRHPDPGHSWDNSAAGLKVSGTYTIDPAGGDPFNTYCDMTGDGGGWTLVLRGLHTNVTGWNTSGNLNRSSLWPAGSNSSKLSDATIALLKHDGYRIQTCGYTKYVQPSCVYQHTGVVTYGGPCSITYTGLSFSTVSKAASGQYPNHLGISDWDDNPPTNTIITNHAAFTGWHDSGYANSCDLEMYVR